MEYSISGGNPNEVQEIDWETGNPNVFGPYTNIGGGYIALEYAGVGWHRYEVRTRRNGSSPWAYTGQWHGGWDPVAPGGVQSGGPAPNVWVNGVPSVAWTGTDAHSGVRRTSYRWNGGPWTTTNGATGSVPVPEGENALSILVEDHTFTADGAEAGNTAIVNLGTFRRDSQTPSASATISGTLGANGWYTTAPVVTVSATDPAPSSGVSRWTAINNDPFTQYSAPVPVNLTGNVSFSYYARDTAGNQSATQVIPLKIDTTPPPTPVLVDEGDATSSDSSLNVVISSGLDPESGTSAVEYTVGNTDNPTLYRSLTTVPSSGPFVEVMGLDLPAGAQVVVRLRTINGAGVAGPWASTDGILIDPAGSPVKSLSYLVSSFGGHTDHPEISQTSAGGETAVGESADFPITLNQSAGFLGSSPAFGVVQGQLSLEGYLGSYTLDAATLEVWQNDVMVSTDSVSPSTSGQYQVVTGRAGNAVLRFRYRSGLSRSFGVVLGSTSVTLNVELTNGDVDRSGEVDAADIDSVISDFGSSGGAGVFSDADGSSEVDAADIDLVIANFGEVGD